MTRVKNNILYYSPGSTFSNVGLLLIHEKGLEDQFEFKAIKLGQDNISPWYIQLNPKGQVPTMIYQSNVVSDSLSIARFLDPCVQPPSFECDNQKVMDFVKPWRQLRLLPLFAGKKDLDQDMSTMESTLAKARAQQLAHAKAHPDLAESYEIRLGVHNERAEMLLEYDQFLFHRHMLNRLLDEAEKALDTNDGHLLSIKQHTLADIYVMANLYCAHQKISSDILVNRSKLKEYYQQQMARPSVAKAFLLA
ncbi:hypothetical protein A0J61_04192 [Choanephora cucurbitarum]|uniref:GST N-terminal domain-containing protein n=1 Tax=Choanephora cucurbitarum TaxID=101091 RepID=A0A1C7NF63_9FUNG|nr:hypothetical protein A0J61_04192 [Choanephora cucurbitarum]